VLILLDGKSLETALPHVAAGAVMAMITPHVAGQQPLHEPAQVAVVVRPEHEVKMIRHQAEAHDPHRQAASTRAATTAGGA